MASYKEHTAHVLKHGLSRTNRFQVLIEIPSAMQTFEKTKDKEKSKLASMFGEVVKVIKVFTGGNSAEITRGLDVMCSQTEMPGKTINTAETKYNGDVHKMGQSLMYGNQQFVFKVSKDMHEKSIIDEWMNLVIDPISHEVGYLRDYATTITIMQLDTEDKVVHSVSLIDAFPVMVNPMTLSNLEQNNVHELMVQFAYRKWVNVALDEPDNGLANSLMQTPLGPYLAPILSNPVVQRGLDYVENATGLDLEGEALNIYNQVDGIVRQTTGESINKTVGLLNGMKASIGVNDKITNNQAGQLIDLIDGTIDRIF
jgi:hypothetical protein